ncbi:MAG TPA: TIGR00730 family Rossman fold protein [Ilumatobacteraceae bacterium]
MVPELTPEIAGAIEHVLDALAPAHDRRFARDLLHAAAGMIADRPTTLDLKIASSALAEMREAYDMFAPFRERRKVTIFGSARTATDDPLYLQARTLAEHLALNDWMVVTGAGPGIMQAAMEGAGRDHSIGVSIRLPFEQGANPVIAGDAKYVSMKYFFTRKLMLVKESSAFVCLPGGFGTLDEMFELLTLTQTGKGVPVPIVLIDTPGDRYWEQVAELVDSQLVARGLVAAADTKLYFVTDTCQAAMDEISRFYSNYDSLRYVGDLLIIRLKSEPTDDQLSALNEQFGHLCTRGSIVRVPAQPLEVRENDRIEYPRIGFAFAKRGYGELRQMIDVINTFTAPSSAVAPAVASSASQSSPDSSSPSA